MGANRLDCNVSNSWAKAITKTADDHAAWKLEYRRTDDEGYERAGCAQIRAVTHRHWLYNLDFYDCYTPKPFLEAMRLWRTNIIRFFARGSRLCALIAVKRLPKMANFSSAYLARCYRPS